MTKKCILAAAAIAVSLPAMTQAQEESWTDSVKVKGDLRLREEYIDQDGKDERNRFRIRARLSLSGQVNDEFQVKVRLASGSDDPVSTNQTLDDSFSSKGINLDRAYLVYSPEDAGVDVWAGKVKNPFIAVKNLVWDSDLNPEGAALRVKQGPLHLNGGAFVVEENSSDSEIYLFGGQAAVDLDATEEVSVMAGASYFLYDGLLGEGLVADSEDSFGNSTAGGIVDPVTGEASALTYAEDYGILELFAKASFDIVSVYGQYVNNTEADENETGFLFGATVKSGKVKVDYNYRDLEADAVLGAFTDSDAGGGGTNIDGHRFQVGYKLAKNLELVGTWFMNGQDPDGVDNDYSRGQLDLKAKF